VHFIAVVAPAAPGPWPLHCSTAIVAALAVVGTAIPAMENPPANNIRAITMARHLGPDTELGVGMLGAGIVPVLM
jgi:hypothetical protein